MVLAKEIVSLSLSLRIIYVVIGGCPTREEHPGRTADPFDNTSQLIVELSRVETRLQLRKFLWSRRFFAGGDNFTTVVDGDALEKTFVLLALSSMMCMVDAFAMEVRNGIAVQTVRRPLHPKLTQHAFTQSSELRLVGR